MPRAPRPAAATAAMPGAVYSPFSDRLREHSGPLIPLHVGDTWMEVFEGARMQDLLVEERAGLHRYGPTQGLPELIDAIVERESARSGLAVERNQVLVTAGATSGLGTIVGATVSPGEEVLILAPFWPLIRGIVQAYRGEPVEVPFYDRVSSAREAVDAVRAKRTSRTVALYVSTPSNPTGRVLEREWLEALAEFAREEDLWLLSDEVYEEFVYEGEHVSLAALAPERSFGVHSFSKTYGMAGNRVGYLTGPAELVHEAHKISTHTAYHAPVAGQLAALRALESGGEWIERARRQHRGAGEDAARTLGLPRPQGSTFLFLDVGRVLDERGMDGFLSDCFDLGVLVAPGASSGRDYADWIRLCYTAVPPDDVREAVAKLATRLG